MKSNFTLFIGFGSFGLLIGLITGITSAEISNTILTALFAFIGGKVFLKIDSKDPNAQIKSGLILSGFAVFCIAGILTGIYIKVNHTLSRNSVNEFSITRGNNSKNSLNKDTNYKNEYLRGFEFSTEIELKYRRGEISADSALTLLFRERR